MDQDPPDQDPPGHDPTPAWSSTLPPVAAPPRRRRRWPWVVALVLALGVAGGALAVAAEQRGVAAAWRDRAVDLEGQRDDALEAARQQADDLETLRALLSRSESDVLDLEGRVRVLANEKAQAEDTATTVQVEREVFSQVTGRIADATDLLDGCVARLFALQEASVDAFNRSTAGEFVDVAPLNAQAAEVTAACNDARSAAAAAGAAAEQLSP